MKQSQNGRRGRSRSNTRKSGKGQDSNRVEIKVRGNPKQLLEKYKNAARDAQQAGDRVLAEHNLQFADHYQRVLNEMRGLTRGLFSGDYVVVERDQSTSDEDDADDDGETSSDNADEGQPQRRPRRPRRAAPPTQRRENGSDGGDKAQGNGSAGVDDSDQPVEVHPELDLSAGSGDQAAKPRRQRRPRRSPASEQTGGETPQESGAA